MDGFMLMIYMSYDVLLHKEMPFGVVMWLLPI